MNFINIETKKYSDIVYLIIIIIQIYVFNIIGMILIFEKRWFSSFQNLYNSFSRKINMNLLFLIF